MQSDDTCTMGKRNEHYQRNTTEHDIRRSNNNDQEAGGINMIQLILAILFVNSVFVYYLNEMFLDGKINSIEGSTLVLMIFTYITLMICNIGALKKEYKKEIKERE